MAETQKSGGLSKLPGIPLIFDGAALWQFCLLSEHGKLRAGLDSASPEKTATFGGHPVKGREGGMLIRISVISPSDLSMTSTDLIPVSFSLATIYGEGCERAAKSSKVN